MTEVAILVAAYNATTTLPRCLESLLNQTLGNIQILCIDDCSTDGTLQLLRQYASKDNRITVLQTHVNSGQAIARNLALEHVNAPYVCMVDADDWLSSDALQKALNVFQEHPATDCVLFKLRKHDDGNGEETDYKIPEKLTLNEALTGQEAFEICLDGWGIHGLYVTRTKLHRRYPFDTATRLYSDDNTTLLHFLHSREVRACEGIYYYRQHSASMTTSFNIHRFDFMEANLSMLFALRKEGVDRVILKRYEGQRWMTFLACYRLYLEHESELRAEDKEDIHKRLDTTLHTFRPSRLPLRYRWKPGYWLLFSTKAFYFQQMAYFKWWVQGLRRLLLHD